MVLTGMLTGMDSSGGLKEWGLIRVETRTTSAEDTQSSYSPIEVAGISRRCFDF